MNDKNFYITTTLPYVNAEPHIGHALEFVQADALARYFRKKLGKENVFFNVGTDEHGLKIWRKAKEEGLEINDFVSKYANRFKDFCKLFFVSYDNFYRTSDPKHIESAREFWRICFKNGDIYKKRYSGKYCVGCERFVTEKELVDGKCPEHGVFSR
ncbi:MAG TPA: class I tRNA ligase family protein, partial [Candidatus Dojkabacteria bacterium]|nr:class I tRNA ligase family protein [Candidatus Dojkabacteria bacterium]